MAIYRKLRLTKRVLYNEAKEVTFEYPERLRKFAEAMIKLMVENNGIGLAAPQVGVSERIFVMLTKSEFSETEQSGQVFFKALFNPEVLEENNECVLGQEGCLSFPGEILEVSRPKSIKVKYYDFMGKEHIEDMFGIDARCFLHELDHLNGITFHEKTNNV